jgi:hypothetical protein
MRRAGALLAPAMLILLLRQLCPSLIETKNIRHRPQPQPARLNHLNMTWGRCSLAT